MPAVPGCPTWRLLTALADPIRDHGRLYAPSFDNSYDTVVAGWTLICPWQPEIAAAHLLRPLSDGLRPGPSPATAAITSLRHPGHPLGPAGHLALVAGLASAEADTRIAAAQLWTDACAGGRLDPVLAADAITTGVRGQALKLNRLADGLHHASHAELAAWRIVQTVCRAVTGLTAGTPANLHLLLETAARLGAAVGVPDLPHAVTELAARRGTTRSPKPPGNCARHRAARHSATKRPQYKPSPPSSRAPKPDTARAASRPGHAGVHQARRRSPTARAH